MIRRPPRSTLFPSRRSSDLALRVRVRCVFHEATADPMVGILIRNRIGMDVYGTNTRVEQVALGEFDAGDELERSEEHTSELQSQFHLVCRLLLEKKKKKNRS